MKIEIPKKSLWQYLDKSTLDDEGQLTDEQWQEFLNKNNDHFASECSYIGRELFEDFLGELEAKEKRD